MDIILEPVATPDPGILAAETLTAPPTNTSSVTDDSYPEGGVRAWLVVLGAWCAMASSTGLMNSFGVLQALISQDKLPEFSESSVGWIFSVHAFIVYFAGAQVGSLFDFYGVRPLVIPGSIGIVVAIMCFSTSTSYYQFLLSFGILGGLSSSLLFVPSMSCVGHWFHRRQGLATGVAFTGGSAGGIIFPMIVFYLGPKLGFPWTVRVIGFICCGLCTISCLLLRTRLPLNKRAGATVDIRALKDVKYGTTTLAIFFIEFAIFIPVTYISLYAIHVGVERQSAYRLLAFLNAASVFGRAIPGYFADRYGRFNVMAFTSAVCSIFILTLWLLCGPDEKSITAFAVMFGFWSGTAIGLTPVCIAQVCRREDYGKRNGTTFAISSFGALLGIPIAGAILGRSSTNYPGLILFNGALYILGSATFLGTRILAGGWRARFIF